MGVIKSETQLCIHGVEGSCPRCHGFTKQLKRAVAATTHPARHVIQPPPVEWCEGAMAKLLLLSGELN